MASVVTTQPPVADAGDTKHGSDSLDSRHPLPIQEMSDPATSAIRELRTILCKDEKHKDFTPANIARCLGDRLAHWTLREKGGPVDKIGNKLIVLIDFVDQIWHTSHEEKDKRSRYHKHLKDGVCGVSRCIAEWCKPNRMLYPVDTYTLNIALAGLHTLYEDLLHLHSDPTRSSPSLRDLLLDVWKIYDNMELAFSVFRYS